MAANVKLKDIGELKCETRHQGLEWVVLYNDPDNPNSKRDMGQYISAWGFGKKYRNPKEALSGLAEDLRRRGYTGSLKNMKPTRVKRGGVEA